jgi:hypothetical protein
MTPVEQTDYNARHGTAEDIINLVSIYSQLETSAKGDLFARAAELLAGQRVRGQTTPKGERYEANDWLENLADDTYPSDETAAQLLQRGSYVHSDWREIVFGDGPLSLVLTSSEEELLCGTGLYQGYRSIENNASPVDDLPSAASYFGFDKNKRNYVEYEYDETEEEWKNGIHRQCAAEFAGMVSLWRHRFFKALLSKAWPEAR